MEYIVLVTNAFGAPQTGAAGSLVVTLEWMNAGTITAGTETVTVTEISAGQYRITFEPMHPGHLYLTTITHGSLFVTPPGFQDVAIGLGAPSSPGTPFTAADSYTTQARVESLVQRGAFVDGGTSHPSKQQVLDFMALRGAEITATLAKAGYAVTPPTIADATVARLCDMANAMLAAGDAILAHDVKDESVGDLVKELWAEGRAQLEAAIAYTAAIVTSGLTVRSSTSTGGITKDDFAGGGTRAEVPLSSRFTMDTRN